MGRLATLATLIAALCVPASRAPAPAPASAPDTRSPENSLYLDDESDRAAFRGWFTFLAESQYASPAMPAEIVDCAALIRFAFREALREHDGRWATDLQLLSVPSLPGVRKYKWPHTPLGARLFRIGPGDDEFAEFADAQSLIRFNTRPVSRDLRAAVPGDLLFYRQLDQTQPFHLMIFLGEHVVYHTGPFHGGSGEVRRPSTAELMRHPAPQWRPHLGNPNFLGVYRWNILCDPGTH